MGCNLSTSRCRARPTPCPTSSPRCRPPIRISRSCRPVRRHLAALTSICRSNRSRCHTARYARPVHLIGSRIRAGAVHSAVSAEQQRPQELPAAALPAKQPDQPQPAQLPPPPPPPPPGRCHGWRQTGGCTSSGSREPQFDKSCTDLIWTIWSGYCECDWGNHKTVGDSCTVTEIHMSLATVCCGWHR